MLNYKKKKKKIATDRTDIGINQNNGLRTFYYNPNLNGNESVTFRISVFELQEISQENFKYEPYYITSSTEVVQNQNHTLTAIWEKDE